MYKIKKYHGEKLDNINLDDSIFKKGIRKELIKKIEDGCIFIGGYEDLLAFKRKAFMKAYEWLE